MTEDVYRTAPAIPAENAESLKGLRPEDTKVGEEFQAAYRDWLCQVLPGAGDQLSDSFTAAPDVLPMGDKQWGVGDLRQLLSAQLGAPQASASLPLRPASAAHGLLAAAWRMTVRRQVKAVLALLDADLTVELLANARIALEHAALLRALGDAEHEGQTAAFVAAVEASAQGHARGLLTSLEDLDQVSGGSAQELLQAVRVSPLNEPPPRRPDREWNGEVAALFARIDSGEYLYALYKWQSQVTHAGITSAMPYLRPLFTDGRLSGQLVPWPLADTLGALSWACWTADTVLDQFLATSSLADQHRQVFKRFGIDA